MGAYVIILLAVFAFAGQFAFTKLYEGSVRQTTVTATVMLVVTSGFGALLYLFIGGFSVSFSGISMLWATLFALIMIPYYIVGIKVLSLGSLAIYGMFMMLGGMLVPFFYGVWFLKETISPFQIAGTALLTFFIVLEAFCQLNAEGERKENSKNNKALFIILCVVIFFVNGFTGVFAKAHQISTGAIDETSFTVISCALTAAFSLVMLCGQLIGRKGKAYSELKTVLKPQKLLIMALIGAAAYTGNFLHLIAANDVPASVQFPLVSGGVIVLSAVVSAFVFKEKLTKNEWISVGGAFLSTVLFAF